MSNSSYFLSSVYTVKHLIPFLIFFLATLTSPVESIPPLKQKPTGRSDITALFIISEILVSTFFITKDNEVFFFLLFKNLK